MDGINSTMKTVNSQRLEVVILDIDDLNTLISILKRREENIIQMLDYNLKYMASTKEDDVRQLKALQAQLQELEKTRRAKEDQTCLKYANIKVTDGKQKRLVLKLVSKIVQLNASVKEKLIELEIYEKTKGSFKGIQLFEENLKALANRPIVDVDVVINYIVKHSQYRLERELDPEYDSRHRITEYELLNYLFDNRHHANQIIQKDLEKENGKLYVSKKSSENNTNQNGSPMKNRPSVQKLQTKELKDFSPDKKKELGKVISSANDTSSLMPKTVPMKPIEKNISKQISYSTVEKTSERLTEMTPTILSRKEYPLPDLSSQNYGKNQKGNKSNKSIASIEDLCSVLPDLRQDIKNNPGLKSQVVNSNPPNDIWKNYDILKIEPRQVPITIKHKKHVMEKLYNELFSYNFEIKRSISKYKTEYAAFNERRKSRPKSNNTTEGNASRYQRSQASTPNDTKNMSTNESQSIPKYPLKSNPYPYSKNRVLDPPTMGKYSNGIGDGILSPPAHTQKQKQQKAVVLPKLHLFEDPVAQNSTIQSQGTPKMENSSQVRNRFFINDRPKSEFLDHGSPSRGPNFENLIEIGYAKSYTPFRDHNLQKNGSPHLRDAMKEFSSSVKPMKGLGSILNKLNEDSLPSGKQMGLNAVFLEKGRGLLDNEEKFNRIKLEYYAQAHQVALSKISANQNQIIKHSQYLELSSQQLNFQLCFAYYTFSIMI